MKWHKISLKSDKAYVNDGKSEIQELFSSIFDRLGNPSNTALFVNHPGGEDVEIFVSPEASKYTSDLLKQYSAVECEKPPKNNLYLFLGQPDAKDVLF